MNQNSLRRHRNFLLESMPQVLSLAKRTENRFVRSKSLKLYFDKKRRLEEIEKDLLSYGPQFLASMK